MAATLHFLGPDRARVRSLLQEGNTKALPWGASKGAAKDGGPSIRTPSVFRKDSKQLWDGKNPEGRITTSTLTGGGEAGAVAVSAGAVARFTTAGPAATVESDATTDSDPARLRGKQASKTVAEEVAGARLGRRDAVDVIPKGLTRGRSDPSLYRVEVGAGKGLEQPGSTGKPVVTPPSGGKSRLAAPPLGQEAGKDMAGAVVSSKARAFARQPAAGSSPRDTFSPPANARLANARPAIATVPDGGAAEPWVGSATVKQGSREGLIGDPGQPAGRSQSTSRNPSGVAGHIFESEMPGVIPASPRPRVPASRIPVGNGSRSSHHDVPVRSLGSPSPSVIDQGRARPTIPTLTGEAVGRAVASAVGGNELIESLEPDLPVFRAAVAQPQEVSRGRTGVEQPPVAAERVHHQGGGGEKASGSMGQGETTGRGEEADVRSTGSSASLRAGQVDGDHEAAGGEVGTKVNSYGETSSSRSSGAKAAPASTEGGGQAAAAVKTADNPSEVTGAAQARPGTGGAEARPTLAGDLVAQLAERITVGVKNGEQTAEVRLHPPELGKLHIRLAVDGDKQVNLRVFAELPMVREALESGISQLREALRQSGLEPRQLDFMLMGGEPRDHHGAGRNQAGRETGESRFWQGEPGRQGGAPGEEELREARDGVRRYYVAEGMVDIIV